jgi:guanosine-3',5'-bis(diphosphate) 3'-pyrophosphohydrolase
MDGMNNIMARFAKCCQPVPGDPIMGIVTRGRGVSVHRTGCKNLSKINESERIVELEWETQPDQRYLVSLIVTARDRAGLVTEISRRVKDLGTEVRSGHFKIQEGLFTLILVMGIIDIKHLNDVIAEIRTIENVISVNRNV